MIISSGKGILGLLVPLIAVLIAAWTTDGLMGMEPGSVVRKLLLSGAFAAGGVFNALLGFQINAERNDHTLYFLPLEWWGIAAAIGGVVMFVAM